MRRSRLPQPIAHDSFRVHPIAGTAGHRRFLHAVERVIAFIDRVADDSRVLRRPSRRYGSRMAASYLDDRLVQAIATIMERRIKARGIVKVGERKDLEPATIAVLGAASPNRVEKERQVAIPDWERVGNADVILRREPGASARTAVVELKWAGPSDDILHEAIYDLFKLALLTQREDRPRAYLRLDNRARKVATLQGYQAGYRALHQDPPKSGDAAPLSVSIAGCQPAPFQHAVH